MSLTLHDTRVRVPYEELRSFTAEVFRERGVPAERAATAADALLYGDLHGLGSHGLANLCRLYLPLLDSGRCDPAAEPLAVRDTGPAVLLDARQALGLWAATEAVHVAADRAHAHGIGLVSVRGGTHFGCAGHHAGVAADRGMIGVVASNCGDQRIARPPGGAVAMLGTNPLSVAAPALPGRPFVLDMSTTVVPTGRVRAAARAGEPVPEGWLAGEDGEPVTDPAAFDRGEAHLRWLGGSPETGAYKGFGLAVAVELLAAALPGAALGPSPAALTGDGRPHGTDDDIGYLVLAIAPGTVRPDGGFAADAWSLFGTLLDCPTTPGSGPVRYPGWLEAERAERHRETGVPLAPDVYRDLVAAGFSR
ncbi:Ldh family oxidoreductase [Actinophytocola gossypii]|uniref:Ldh family oxidoreductase n=1 Tax=Actinophytocola gossypii TaxID=2812003 RepID=A0ABT2JCF3_9PSEU|nr:Ldh family oxidoreductase [Actinophytocola gossypii]MCT2585542.1 Ldh family oxidoreductase [Actinophytocola gossypii]